eukprot:GHVN01033760.1.p1 GENE.GHVN01033760.1~~GHVN01033760.1.p1  ORF type:complete len:326 (-),score=35.70 GHVN01033760.1:723-1700(-)
MKRMFIPECTVQIDGRRFLIVMTVNSIKYNLEIGASGCGRREVKLCKRLDMFFKEQKGLLDEILKQSLSEKSLAINISFLLYKRQRYKRKSILDFMTRELYKRIESMEPALDRASFEYSFPIEGTKGKLPILDVSLVDETFRFEAKLPIPLKGTSFDLEEAVFIFEHSVSYFLLLWATMSSFEQEARMTAGISVQGKERDWADSSITLLVLGVSSVVVWFDKESHGWAEIDLEQKERVFIGGCCKKGNQRLLGLIKERVSEKKEECGICFGLISGKKAACTGRCPGVFHVDCVFEWNMATAFLERLGECLLCGDGLEEAGNEEFT